MVVEGVLQKLVGGQELREGISLYHCFFQGGYDVILVSNHMSDVSDWLWKSGLTRHSLVVSSVEEAMAKGHNVTLVVTPNPEQARRLFAQGVTTLLFAHPSYAQPDWRPDYIGPKVGWNELSREIADEAARKLADHRMDDLAA
jgi:hypothetical protein